MKRSFDPLLKPLLVLGIGILLGAVAASCSPDDSNAPGDAAAGDAVAQQEASPTADGGTHDATETEDASDAGAPTDATQDSTDASEDTTGDGPTDSGTDTSALDATSDADSGLLLDSGPADSGPSDSAVPDSSPPADSGSPDGGATPITLPASGVCTYDGWCLRNPLPVFSRSLDAVWGSAGNDLWVGGQGVIAHYDGSSWTGRVTDVSTDIMGLFGSASNDIWALVDAKNLWRWSGAEWAVQPFSSSFNLAAGWARTPSDAWVVGQSGTIFHWNGATWASTPSGTVEDLTGVFGFATDDVWAVGGASVRHWNGTAWVAAAALPSGAVARHVWGAANNDVWVQGDKYGYHWDGTAWTPQLAANMQTGGGVWGTSSNDVFFLGASESYRWNGSSMQIAGYLYSPCAPHGIWGSGSTYTIVTGYDVLHPTVCGLMGADASGMHSLMSAWSVTPVAAAAHVANDVWFLGPADSSIYHGFGSTTPVAWGSTSVSVAAITPRALNDVWVSGQSGGVVSHFDGTSWSPMVIGGPVAVTKVWSNASSDAWAGAGTHVFHWDGSGWTDTGAVSSMSPTTVIGFGAMFAFAGVQNGGLYAYSSGAWANVGAVTGPVFDLWGTGPNDVFAQGDIRLWHFDGTTWTPLSVPLPTYVSSAWFSPNDLWLASPSGNAGAVQHWTGGSALSVQPVGFNPLASIAGSGDNDLWAVEQYTGALWHRGP